MRTLIITLLIDIKKPDSLIENRVYDWSIDF